MKGYTCCIDLQELGKTVEILSSVSDCILNNNLTNIFYDMDNKLKKIRPETAKPSKRKNKINSMNNMNSIRNQNNTDEQNYNNMNFDYNYI